jgi:hypothetical protein
MEAHCEGGQSPPRGFNAKEEDCTNYMENWKLLKWIRSARLRLAGHIVCMRVSDPARKSTFDLHMVERMVGRPKRRWIEEVETELKGIRCYRLERDKLKKIVEEAKA